MAFQGFLQGIVVHRHSGENPSGRGRSGPLAAPGAAKKGVEIMFLLEWFIRGYIALAWAVVLICALAILVPAWALLPQLMED
jgi:hypothetical protein